ncbi:MAG TPA: hypothetical protein VK455_04790 [Thermoplasmata archaeon]|nr:hypothetical protein [Thermoplasmata archaeon]
MPPPRGGGDLGDVRRDAAAYISVAETACEQDWGPARAEALC